MTTEEIGITRADAAPAYGTYAPLVSPGGVAFFGHDQHAGAQVWSGDCDAQFVRDLEDRHNIFPNLDPDYWQQVAG